MQGTRLSLLLFVRTSSRAVARRSSTLIRDSTALRERGPARSRDLIAGAAGARETMRPPPSRVCARVVLNEQLSTRPHYANS